MSQIEAHAKRLGITVRQLCFRAGADYSTYWRWKHRRSEPRQATVDKLLAVKR